MIHSYKDIFGKNTTASEVYRKYLNYAHVYENHSQWLERVAGDLLNPKDFKNTNWGSIDEGLMADYCKEHRSEIRSALRTPLGAIGDYDLFHIVGVYECRTKRTDENVYRFAEWFNDGHLYEWATENAKHGLPEPPDDPDEWHRVA